jgi:hypothetical protein
MINGMIFGGIIGIAMLLGIIVSQLQIIINKLNK